jgi:Fe-S cluster assembly protein SufD
MQAKLVKKHTTSLKIGEEQKFQFDRSDVINFRDEKLPGYLGDYYRHAWDVFERLPLPSTKEEAWRRTDLRGLKTDTFLLPESGQQRSFTPIPKRYLQPLLGEQHGGEIIISPDVIDISINERLVDEGLIFTDLHTALRAYPNIVERIIGEIVKPEEGKFAAMAAAFAENGILLYIPKGMHIEQPLHSVFWGPGKNLAHFSHVLVYLEDDASITYLHESASPDEIEGQTLHAGIVEIHVGAQSKLRFVELQSWGKNVWNFSHERARVQRDGTIEWIFGAVGSHLTKNFSDIDLVGSGATGLMSGFYFTDGKQHLDHDTQQNHFAPNTTSDLLFKGALKGSSRSVWQGMIYVAPGAQKTNGYQANRNLILSRNARADSIPGLEILANDVRCTHGATVGKIDADQVFYLRSRGIPYEEAERLIVEGFFDPIMQRIPFEGVKNRFQSAIVEKLG